VAVDVYISIDVEADGPIPGPYSMLALGMAVAGRFDGKQFVPADPERETFYTELRPISDAFDPSALEVAGVDRDALLRTGPSAEEAMAAAAEWVRRVSHGATPVAVCWPLAFDWLFVYWYFVRFCPDPPFGFSACLDMKTAYQQKAQVTIERAGKDDVPSELRPRHQHTHHARDDAVEQAELWAKLLTWRAPGAGR
jgi:hypothetical protein